MNRELMQRALDAWDSSPLPKASDGMMQEAMEDLRAALAAPVAPAEPTRKPGWNGAMLQEPASVGDKPATSEPVAYLVGKSVFESRRAAEQYAEGAAVRPLYTAPPDVQRDAARLDWLLLNISGKEFRRIGIEYAGGCKRADVDAAMTYPKAPT